MAIIWLFLKSNWKLVAVGITVTLILGYIGILKHQVKAHVKTIEAQKVTLLAEKALNASLNDSLEKQNDAVAAIKATSEAQKKTGAALLAQAQKRNAGLSEKARWLEELLHRPDAQKKDCSAAVKEFKDAI